MEPFDEPRIQVIQSAVLDVSETQTWFEAGWQPGDNAAVHSMNEWVTLTQISSDWVTAQSTDTVSLLFSPLSFE